MMGWKNWVVILLVLATAGWMLFDGARALVVGDYVTPADGEYAGQLGPWANLVQAIGLEPRSTLMKSIFVSYGLAALATLALFVFKYRWARIALILVCILGLWYLPIGTLTNIIVVILLFTGRT
ncbi:MAG: hypothetical protein AB1649_16700 [Chloroflexota bacterium]